MEDASSNHNNINQLLKLYEPPMLMLKLKSLLFHENLSDVMFIVGKDEEKIYAHKFVLAIGSKVFEAMFYGTFASAPKEIVIPEIEPKAFRNLLNFIYTEEITINEDTVLATLYTAKKYNVNQLEEACITFLAANLTVDNVGFIMKQAVLFEIQGLLDKCWKEIDKSTEIFVNSNHFLDVDYSTLLQMLKRDSLQISELNLYNAVLRWAASKCSLEGMPVSSENQRKVLGDCISQMRFPLMTSEEFSSGPAQDGLLTQSQVIAMFIYFHTNPKPCIEFLDIARRCLSDNEWVCHRFSGIGRRWGYSSNFDKVVFVVDRTIFVTALGLYGSCEELCEYSIETQIVHYNSNKVLSCQKNNYYWEGPVPKWIAFKDPVKIDPHIEYAAVATLKGADSFYGTKGASNITVTCRNSEKVTFKFQSANGHSNGTCVKRGQIPQIYFHL